MDFATPYDILRHTKGDFYENLQSKKWNERKDAIGGLVEIMDKNPRLAADDAVAHHRLITELNKILKQDSNINVAAVTAAALTRLARGLGSAFRPFATTILLTSLNRLKEVKPVLRDPCIECLDACYASTSFDAVLPCIKEGLTMKAPGSKLQTCEFFTRIMLKLDLQTAKKSAAATKEVVEELCKMALGSDATCREGAMKSLAAFLKAIGKQAGMPLIAPVVEDKLKMAKVDEYFEQFASEVPKEETLQSTNDLPTEPKKTDDQNANVSEKKLSEFDKLRAVILGHEFLTPYNLLKHTTEDFYDELQSKKWDERKDAIGKLVEIMDKNPRLTTDDAAGHHRLISQLTKILKQDSNINVAATAAMALTRLARGSAITFRAHSPDVITTCLTRLKEVKPVLRDPCIVCLDACFLSSTFDTTLPCIKEGLAMKAPGSKLQTCEFFTRIMLDVDLQTAKNSAAATKEVVGELCKLALGSDANCRDAAMKSLAAFLRAVGKQAGASLLSSVAEDKLKMAKVDEYYDQYIKDFPSDVSIIPKNNPPAKSASATTKRPTSNTTRPSAPVQNHPKTQPVKPQIVKTEPPTLREQNGVTPATRPSVRPVAKPIAVVPKTLAALGKPNHQPSVRGKIESTETSRPVSKTIRRSEGPTLLQQRRMDSAPRISTIRPTPTVAPTRTLSAYRMSVDDPRRREQSNRASTAHANQTPSRRPTSVTRPISANVVNRQVPIKPNVIRMPTNSTETLKLTSTASESNRQTNGTSQQISQSGDVQQNEATRRRSALPAPRRSMLPTPSASIRPTNPQTKI